MHLDKTTSVAVIYQCSYISEPIIRNRPKLQRRLCRAIEDMAEDGFSNFILPIERENPFATTFINAIIAEREHNHHLRLTISHTSNDDQCGMSPYTQYADQIINAPTENLLEKSAAVILYFERNCSKLHSTIHQAVQNRLPFININL